MLSFFCASSGVGPRELAARAAWQRSEHAVQSGAVAPRRQLMHGIDVTTLRSTLERPSGGYFSPGLEQRLEPKRLVLASVFQAASSLFWPYIVSEQQAAGRGGRRRRVSANYVLNCGDNVARRPTIDDSTMKGLMDFT